MTIWIQINTLLFIILLILAWFCWYVDRFPDNRPGGVLTFIRYGLPLTGVTLLSNVGLGLYVSFYG